jgi:small subunit ribosomal protein S21
MDIEVRHGDIEGAIKIFKREMAKDGILKELKNRRSYEKPSVKKKRKQLEARRRRLKEARKRSRVK